MERKQMITKVLVVALLLTVNGQASPPVAGGLDHPRGMAFGDDGTLYVAEAGDGTNGAVTAIRDGRVRRIAAAAGPSDVTLGGDGEVYLVDGWGFRRADGRASVRTVGEATSVLAVERGFLVIAGGDLRRIGPRGRVQTVATFPRRPTALASGPDGAAYLSEGTRIWRIVPGHAPTLYADGFTDIVDLAWGDDARGDDVRGEGARESGGGRGEGGRGAGGGGGDGSLHVLQGSGAGLVRVGADGRHRVILGAVLTAPGGLAIRGRDAYISTGGENGAVLRVRI
ncbi:hypothetical protein [Actinoplanes sp. NPDC051851]|uniref:hypothetical protein n=1 Tax=Actinoplanes sp. NPDC051851 TaxID=3154753 RepID=UPI003438E1C0